MTQLSGLGTGIESSHICKEKDIVCVWQTGVSADRSRF